MHVLYKQFVKGLMFLKPLIDKVKKDDISGQAAQLSYYFLFSLFPLLVFMFSLLPYLPIEMDDIIGVISNVAPENTLNMITSNLQGVLDNRNGGILSVGIIVALYSASKGMNAVIRCLNRAYEVDENRNFIIVKAMSILLTIAMIFVVVMALVLPVFGKHIGEIIFSFLHLPAHLSVFWTAIRWILSPVILFFIFLLLYYFAPNIKVTCLKAYPGALFASIGWLIVSFGFSFYVDHFSNYASTYGSLGGIIVLMLWLYLSAFILMIGGIINAIIHGSSRHCEKK